MERKSCNRRSEDQNRQFIAGTRSLRAPAMGCRGQQFLEYSILIVALATALTMMYVYVKRGLQASIRATADSSIGPQSNFFPDATDQIQKSNSTVETLTKDSGHVTRNAGTRTYNYETFAGGSGNDTVSTSELVLFQ